MGLIRNLTSTEILGQFFYALKICRIGNIPEINNVVFMVRPQVSHKLYLSIRSHVPYHLIMSIFILIREWESLPTQRKKLLRL